MLQIIRGCCPKTLQEFKLIIFNDYQTQLTHGHLNLQAHGK